MSIIESTETIHGEEITNLIESSLSMPDTGRAVRLSALAVQSLFLDSLLDFCKLQTPRRNVY